MNNKKAYPTFGKLLNYYRIARGFSLTELKSQLGNLNYHVSSSMLSKYENGESFPPPEFVIACRYGMRLSEEQFNGLIEAITSDFHFRLFSQHTNIVNELKKTGTFAAKSSKKHFTSIFISYSRKDEKIANLVAKRLKEAGFDIWLDKKEIAIGEPILDRISKGITQESEYVLIMLSKHSMNSEWCKVELRLAYDKELVQKRIIVIPVKIDDADAPAEIKIKRYYDLNPSSLVAVNDLIREIKRLVKKQSPNKLKNISMQA